MQDKKQATTMQGEKWYKMKNKQQQRKASYDAQQKNKQH